MRLTLSRLNNLKNIGNLGPLNIFTMNKFEKAFQKLDPIIAALGRSPWLQTISVSMVSTIAITLIGSISVLLIVFPIDSVHQFFVATKMIPVFSGVATCTLGILALYVTFFMARHLVSHYDVDIDGSLCGIASVMTFLIVTPLADAEGNIASIPLTWLGVQGVFSAMLIGLGVGRLFIFVVQRGWTIKMPKGVPPMISRVFQGLLPFLTIGLVALLINRAFMETPWGSFHQCIYTLIQQPLKGLGGSLLAFLLVTLIMQIFWFLGIHGTNVVLPLVTPIWLAMDLENLAAWQNGQELPNVLGLAFFNIVTWGGLALGLVLLMCLSRSKQFKQVGRLALTPALFGITEPVIFGTPLVMNYHLMVPFITNNAIAITLSWALIKMGLVAKIVGAQTIFGLPLGFFASIGGATSIVLLHLFLQLILSPLLWFPWFKLAEKEALKREAEEAN